MSPLIYRACASPPGSALATEHRRCGRRHGTKGFRSECMKKIGVLVGLLLIATVGCGGQQSPGSPAAPAQQSAAPPTAAATPAPAAKPATPAPRTSAPESGSGIEAGEAVDASEEDEPAATRANT